MVPQDLIQTIAKKTEGKYTAISTRAVMQTQTENLKRR